jgi:uncharacterized protein (TIGR00296 family)
MKDFVLKTAREAIENYVRNGRRIAIPKNFPKELNEKRGVFVTIYKKSKELRGCIGLPYPELPLIEGLIEAAIQACKDPRFSPLSKEELKDVFIEVSILSEPEFVKIKNSKEYTEKIELGKHGLIIKNGIFSGLFLPQVPVEQNWSIDEYLENLCYKAGLTSDAWLDSFSKIFKFETKIFSEK